MRRSRTAAEGGAPSGGCRFVLYVEGPRDHDVIRQWAQRLSPGLARAVQRCSVILGGRRPARALEHFREARRTDPVRAVCVLDRDDAVASREPHPEEPGLAFYTWRRRHIESYLLVPEAIRRSLRLPQGDPRIAPLFRQHLPAEGDDEAWGELDAKRLLASRGPLAEGLGRPLDPGRIARAMREPELHRDVLDLFSLVREGLGISGSPRVDRRV